MGSEHSVVIESLPTIGVYKTNLISMNKFSIRLKMADFQCLSLFILP